MKEIRSFPWPDCALGIKDVVLEVEGQLHDPCADERGKRQVLLMPWMRVNIKVRMREMRA